MSLNARFLSRNIEDNKIVPPYRKYVFNHGYICNVEVRRLSDIDKNGSPGDLVFTSLLSHDENEYYDNEEDILKVYPDFMVEKIDKQYLLNQNEIQSEYIKGLLLENELVCYRIYEKWNVRIFLINNREELYCIVMTITE